MDRGWIERRAAELRKTMPDAEVILWTFLQNRQLGGHKFRRQYVVGRAILDFYCPQRRLAVEVDGATHDVDEDERRDAWLATKGIQVLRVDNDEVYREIYDVLVHITNQLEGRPVHSRNRRLR